MILEINFIGYNISLVYFIGAKKVMAALLTECAIFFLKLICNFLFPRKSLYFFLQSDVLRTFSSAFYNS